MTIFRLSEEMAFPHPSLAGKRGLLAIGGDLSPRRLLLAYSLGIFPWYEEESSILWWSPDPRTVLFPEKIKISKSLRRIMRKGSFEVSMDKAFSRVIKECARVRLEYGKRTWLLPEMITAYEKLYRLGYAHSVETWFEGHLVGGLYGVSVGKSFSGESMFSRMSNASKVALVFLACALNIWDFRIIDCQIRTDHLIFMGAEEIPRNQFLDILKEAVMPPTRNYTWTNDFNEILPAIKAQF